MSRCYNVSSFIRPPSIPSGAVVFLVGCCSMRHIPNNNNNYYYYYNKQAAILGMLDTALVCGTFVLGVLALFLVGGVTAVYESA